MKARQLPARRLRGAACAHRAPACSPPAAAQRGPRRRRRSTRAAVRRAGQHATWSSSRSEGNAAGWTQQTVHHASTRNTSTRASPTASSNTSAARRARAKATTSKTARSVDRAFAAALKLGVSAPAPADAAKRAELARSLHRARRHVRRRQVLPAGPNKDGKKTDCKNLDELGDTIATSRNYEELTEAWAGWHSIAKPMRPKYQRFVELANEGARELGFDDLGVLWRVALRHARRGFREGSRRGSTSR